MPDRTPGSRTMQGTSNHRLAIWRRAAVTRGTDDVTAIPLTTVVDVHAVEGEQLR